MEVIPIISTAHHNNNNSSHTLKEEEGNKPSEKSVETTASSTTAVDTAPSINYIHDDCDDTTLNEIHQQQQHLDHTIDDTGDVAQQNFHDDGGGADVLPGYEICISSSSSAAASLTAAASSPAAASSTAAANSVEDAKTEDEIIVQTLHNNASNNVENEGANIKEKKKPLQKTRPDSPLPNVLRASSSSAAAASGAAKKKKTEQVVPLGPASHIYALRQIIVDYVDDDDDDDESVDSLSSLVDNDEGDGEEEEEDGVDSEKKDENGEGGKTTNVANNNENCGAYNDDEEDDVIFYDAQEDLATIPPTTNNNTSQARIKKRKMTTRLISTQMVQLSEEQHVKLEECSVGGTVLCAPSSWTGDDNDGGGDKLPLLSSLEEGEEVNDEEELTFVDAVDEIVAEEGVVNDDAEVVVGADNIPPPRLVSSTDGTTDANSSSIEDQVAVVPYCTARRRMGCNCIKEAEGDDSNKKDAHEKKKRRRRPFKAAYQQIKRTLFYCHLNKKQSYDDTTNKGGEEEICKECNFFGNNPPSKKGKRKVRRPRPSPHQFRNVGATLYGNEAVINNTAEPINDILNIDPTLGIYVCESGLTSSKCQEIIDAAESLASWKGGAWSAYTYAKQTLGCKEYDILAEASKEPVMAACATVRDRLEGMWSLANKGNDSTTSGGGGRINETNDIKPNNEADKGEEVQESAHTKEEEESTKPPLVLDVREPHVVKYDLSRMERQKLDMHTDRSVWTFIIALSEGRGHDYAGGGTYFEKLNATIHLQRGQMIIFRGKLRHRGVKITDGKRYLLVGFLVEQKSDSKQKQKG